MKGVEFQIIAKINVSKKCDVSQSTRSSLLEDGEKIILRIVSYIPADNQCQIFIGFLMFGVIAAEIVGYSAV
jgi:hypothetical protein